MTLEQMNKRFKEIVKKNDILDIIDLEEVNIVYDEERDNYTLKAPKMIIQQWYMMLQLFAEEIDDSYIIPCKLMMVFSHATMRICNDEELTFEDHKAVEEWVRNESK